MSVMIPMMVLTVDFCSSLQRLGNLEHAGAKLEIQLYFFWETLLPKMYLQYLMLAEW